MLEDFHKHKCLFCAFVWQHHNVNDVSHGGYGAHECPCCHRCNWGLGIYDGPDEPKVMNGKTPIEPMQSFAIHRDQDKRHGDLVE